MLHALTGLSVCRGYLYHNTKYANVNSKIKKSPYWRVKNCRGRATGEALLPTNPWRALTDEGSADGRWPLLAEERRGADVRLVLHVAGVVRLVGDLRLELQPTCLGRADECGAGDVVTLLVELDPLVLDHHFDGLLDVTLALVGVSAGTAHERLDRLVVEDGLVSGCLVERTVHVDEGSNCLHGVGQLEGPAKGGSTHVLSNLSSGCDVLHSISATDSENIT